MTAQPKTSLEVFSEFAWAIPKSFSVPLGDCRFEQGDRLYNTPKAYEGTWNDALAHIDYSIEILSPRRGEGIQKSEKDSASIFSANWSSPVRLAITYHRETRSEEIRTTQGRLYSLLWNGDLSIVQTSKSEPKIPFKTLIFGDNVEREIEYFRPKVTKRFPCSFFLMPFDETNGIFVGKSNSIREGLSQDFVFELHKERPHVIYGTDSNVYAPTLYLACYVINSADAEQIESALKKALYVPVKNKITDRENWNLLKHGRLVTVTSLPKRSVEDLSRKDSLPTVSSGSEVGI